MPSYIFKCPKCKQSQVLYCSITEGPPVAPECSCGSYMQRDYSGYGGFVLKGQGWPGKDGNGG